MKDTASIKLSGSENNVTYTLCKNNVKLNKSMLGTGSSLDFGDQYQSGLYSVLASKNGTTLTNKMKGNQPVLLNPLPVGYFILGGGYYNSAIGGAPIHLNLTESGINYQLFNNSTAVGTPITGTGDSISFGIQTSEGLYTVVGTNPETSCTNAMLNFVLISYKTKTNDAQNPSIKVSPNPSSGSFVINFGKPNENVNQVSIYSLAGALVFEQQIERGLTVVPIVTNLSSGVYNILLRGTGAQFAPAKIMIHSK